VDGLVSSRGGTPFIDSAHGDDPDTDIDEVVYSVVSDSNDDDSDADDDVPEKPSESAEAELSMCTSHKTQCYSPFPKSRPPCQRMGLPHLRVLQSPPPDRIC
jgi:hypothetical protein